MAGLISGYVTGKKYLTKYDYVHGISPDLKDEAGLIGRSGEWGTSQEASNFYDELFVDGPIPEMHEPITSISVYKERTGTVLPIFHTFVVLETDGGAFCLERFCHSTVLRQAKEADTLINYGIAGERKTKLLTGKARGTGTMAEVIKMTCDERLASTPYNLLKNSCHTLAQKVFGKFNLDGQSFHPFKRSKDQADQHPKPAGWLESFRRLKSMTRIF